MVRLIIYKVLVVIVVSLGLCLPALAAEHVFKLGHLTNEQSPWQLTCLKLAEIVNKNSDGKIEIQIFPNAQLGNEIDNINGIQLGTADMTITGESLQHWAPKTAMLAVPYAIRDLDHMIRVADGPIGKEIEAQIIEKANLVPVAWIPRGPRNLTSNRPIKTPANLCGMRLRLPNVPLYLSVWSALGARPVPMTFGNVFTALQQGTIEGQENPYSLTADANFFDVQTHLNKTEHVNSWIYVVLGKRQFDKLSEDLQQVLLDAGKEMHEYACKLLVETEEKYEKQLQDQGMIFVDVDKDAFRDAARKALVDILTPDQRRLYEAIQQM